MRVLISGAGIAGPSLAWFLSRVGARITVLEKSQTLLPHGQNVDIQGSARTLIKKMGLSDQFRRFHTAEEGSQFVNSHGRPVARFPVNQGYSASLTSEYEILRADLAAILFEATKDRPNINYLFGTTVKEVVSNDENSVKIELSNGEVEEFDLLVAADGQWSRLRRQCFPAECVTVVDQGMYAAYWTIPRLPSDNNWWNIYLALGSRIITTRPDPHGTVRAMLTHMPSGDAQKAAWQLASRGDRPTQEELIRKEFTNAGWQSQRLLDAMSEAPDFYFHPIQQIKMSKWSDNRIVCIGDAAYAPTPLTGMGTSLAILGAYVLAGEMSKLPEGEHPRQALEAYERMFRPFVTESQEIPSFVPGVAHPDTVWKRWTFQTFLWSLSKVVALPWVRNRFDHDNAETFRLPAYPRFDVEGSRVHT